MAISTAVGAAPVFLSRSYISADSYVAGDLLASSMQAIVHRVYQMDPSSYWQGSLGASDAFTETITVGLYQGAAQVPRSIDTIILFNINLKDFLLEYSADNGGSWTTIANVTGNASSNYVNFLGSPITANKLRLTMTATFPANGNKIVGNFIAALSTFQMSNPPVALKPAYNYQRRDIELADGTLDTTFLYWSDNSFTLLRFNFTFDLVPQADKDLLDAIAQQPDPFLCYVEPGDVTRSLYLCLFENGTYAPEYTGQWKGAGYKIPFKLRQIGYV